VGVLNLEAEMQDAHDAKIVSCRIAIGHPAGTYQLVIIAARASP
jgi:hypothetical protein